MPKVPPPNNTTPPAPADLSPLAPLLALIAPVPVIARWWREMGLHWAYGVHFFGLFVGWIGLEFVNGVVSPGSKSFTEQLVDELQMAGSDLPLVLAAVVSAALTFEAGFVLLAWVLMPLGAAPEPWTKSMARGWVRVLQITPFHAVSLVLFIFIMERIDRSRSLTSHEQEAYLFAAVWLTYAGSQIVVTLWAVAIHGDQPTWAAACPWPAECEKCGYQLMGGSSLDACPECGLDVQVSLQSRRNTIDRRGLLHRMGLAVLTPNAFGRRTPLRRPVNDHFKALAIGAGLMLPAVVLGFVFIIVAISIREERWVIELRDLVDDGGQITFGITVAWTVTLAGVLAIGLLSTGIHGALTRLIHKRNILYPAAQALGYQFGYFALVTAVGYPIGALSMRVYDDYRFRGYYYGSYSYGYSPPPPWVELLPFVSPVYVLLALLGFFVLQWRLLRACRYGNG